MTVLHWIMLLLGITPANAATVPAFLPARDVAVSYEVAAPGRPAVAYQLAYNAAGELARIENPAQGIYVLVDVPAGSARLVVPALHAIVDAPDLAGLTRQLASADEARFTPLGRGEYAGLGCDKYLVLNGDGSGVACITRDGVILHFAGKDAHGAADVTAIAVSYGPQPAGDFAAPDGFSDVTLPPGALAQLLGGG